MNSSGHKPEQNQFWLNVIVGLLWSVFTFFLVFPISWLAATCLPQERVSVELVKREANRSNLRMRTWDRQSKSWQVILRTPSNRTMALDVSKQVYDALHPVAASTAPTIELSRTRVGGVPVSLTLIRPSMFGEQQFSLLKIDTSPKVSTYDLRPELVLVIGALILNIIFYVTAVRSPKFKLHNPISLLIAGLGFGLGCFVGA